MIRVDDAVCNESLRYPDACQRYDTKSARAKRSTRRRYSFANSRRELYLAQPFVYSASDICSFAQFFEWNAGIDSRTLVEVVRQMPGQNDAPVEGDRRCYRVHHVEDRGGTVRREYVVETWVYGKVVCLFDVFDEQRTGALWR